MDMFNIEPFSLEKKDKSIFLDSQLSKLYLHHFNNCNPYKKMMKSIGYDPKISKSYEDLPFLPVRLFKMHDLFSIEKDKITKTMTSSGTSGQEVSKIYIDKQVKI